MSGPSIPLSITRLNPIIEFNGVRIDNDGRANFTRTIPLGPPDVTARIGAAVDLNADGWLDLVTTDERVKQVTVYLADGRGAFQTGMIVGDRTDVPYAMAIADLNGDRHPDIVVGYVQARPAVFFSDGTGTTFRPVLFGDNEGTAYGFGFGDLNGDTLIDIAMARSEARNMVYFAVQRK